MLELIEQKREAFIEAYHYDFKSLWDVADMFAISINEVSILRKDLEVPPRHVTRLKRPEAKKVVVSKPKPKSTKKIEKAFKNREDKDVSAFDVWDDETPKPKCRNKSTARTLKAIAEAQADRQRESV